MKIRKYIEPDHVTAEQLLIAVESLASSPRSLEERLQDVHSYLRNLNVSDFPEELQDSFREIRAKLDMDLRDEQASEVAKMIVRLHDTLVRDYCLPISMQ